MAIKKTLYVRFNSESHLNNSDAELQDSYEATKLTNGLYVGKIRDRDQNVYSIEVGYGGDKELTWVGKLDHTNKKYSFTHGYYTPHPTGKKFEKWAIKNGFELR